MRGDKRMQAGSTHSTDQFVIADTLSGKFVTRSTATNTSGNPSRFCNKTSAPCFRYKEPLGDDWICQMPSAYSVMVRSLENRPA